ncbi:small integral membrane protein 12-A [Drosophila montana]|uniref:small integral membrane protein 12-A n=1 Tax=Drosophila montana TaxID=40370 RepID=UPI00313E53B4
MWPVVMALLRRNAVYITLPIAAVVGFIGYNLENLMSDKYTPYSPSIQEVRSQRQTDESLIENPGNVGKLQLTASVLERNLSPSLQPKA